MKKYSAIVKDGSRLVIIENQEYRTKAEFIHDLRCNGYRVNSKKVKPSDVFDYIMQHTNCEPKDWNLTEVPQETSSEEGSNLPKFEVGKTYATRSICDHECIFEIKIISRTAKTVTYDYMGETRRSKIHTDSDGEFIRPDRYPVEGGTVIGFEDVPDGRFSRGSVFARIRWDSRPDHSERVKLSDIHHRGWRSVSGSPLGVFVAE